MADIEPRDQLIQLRVTRSELDLVKDLAGELATSTERSTVSDLLRRLTDAAAIESGRDPIFDRRRAARADARGRRAYDRATPEARAELDAMLRRRGAKQSS
jgi:DNA-binding MarR family transcriptional regulator